MTWYKTLDINKRIALKELCKTICGVTWEQLRLLFSMSENIELLYRKLQLEGFEL